MSQQIQVFDPSDFNSGKPVSTTNPLPVQMVGGGGANPAQDGTDSNTVSVPAGSGAVGIRGWLSLIFGGIGTPSDAAWSGSGAGTLVAIGKALWGRFQTAIAVTQNGLWSVTQAGTWSVIASGAAAVGSPPGVPPVPVSGVDTNGNKQHLLTDPAGRQIVSDVSYATHAPAYYPITVTSSAQTMATLIGAAIPFWATMAFVTPESGPIRYRADGTPPTSGAGGGQPIPSGQPWPIQGAAALAAVQFIGSAASTTVSVEFRG